MERERERERECERARARYANHTWRGKQASAVPAANATYTVYVASHTLPQMRVIPPFVVFEERKSLLRKCRQLLRRLFRIQPVHFLGIVPEFVKGLEKSVR